MKRILLITLSLIIFSQIIYSQNSKLDIGVLAMFGGRYDNVRMCIATPADVKGGPMADVMLSMRYNVNENSSIVTNIPVFRPILFAISSKMLQFEPEVNFEKLVKINEKRGFVHGPGVGLSFHYGPGYTSSNDDNREDSFFAMGPIVNYKVGLVFFANHENHFSLKAFYTPLFTFGKFQNGTVVGGALQYSLYF